MWLHEISNYVLACIRYAFTSQKIYMFHRHYTRVYFQLMRKRLINNELSSSDSEVSQGRTATATSLLDAPKLFELGIMNFFRHNDNNCEHNIIRFGENAE